MIKDMPKLECPFVRKEINIRYVVTPEINEKYEWVFNDPEVRAVEKVDGTCVSVIIEDGRVSQIYNRLNKITLFSVKNRGEAAINKAILTALEKGRVSTEDGQYFGEAVGGCIQGNPLGLPEVEWLPLDYLFNHCFWKSWSQNRYPKTFEAISDWFKDLPSLYAKRLKLPPVQSEGIVFTHPDGRMAKLRKDMFDWCKD